MAVSEVLRKHDYLLPTSNTVGGEATFLTTDGKTLRIYTTIRPLVN